MSQRNKLIVLGALVLVVGILAYHQLAEPKSPARDTNPSTPPARGAPAAAGAQAKPADSAQDSGPSAADLRQLADWFGVLNSAGAVVAKGDAPVLGMVAKKELPVPAAGQPPQETAPTPLIMEPGKLDGIVKVANGPGKALFQGELYQVGERVRGTNFTIVAVDDDSVTLKSDTRVIRRFWHD
jgi:hypothetical protein